MDREKTLNRDLGCGLGFTPALFVTRSADEAAHTACGAVHERTFPPPFTFYMTRL